MDTVGTGVVVAYNDIHDNDWAGLVIEYSSGGVRVYYNKIYNNEKNSAASASNNVAGIILYAGTSNAKIYNNVSYNNINGIYMNATAGSRGNQNNNEIKNNIFLGNTRYQLLAWDGACNDGVYGNGNVYTYNSLGQERTSFIRWGSAHSEVHTYASWEAYYGSSTHSVQSNPLFTNSATSNFTLQSTSPAINAGVSVGLTRDYANTSVPQGNAPDVGVYEYVSIPSFASCNTVSPANFSQAAYNSYGAPYDLFAGNAQLVDAKCTSSDTHTITATLGKTGDATRIVYTRGYYYDPGISNWAQYISTCTGALSGEWCAGPVTATINDVDISTASAGAPTYFVGVVCSVQGGNWKCGCRDTTCNNFYWMVQGAGM